MAAIDRLERFPPHHRVTFKSWATAKEFQEVYDHLNYNTIIVSFENTPESRYIVAEMSDMVVRALFVRSHPAVKDVINVTHARLSHFSPWTSDGE